MYASHETAMHRAKELANVSPVSGGLSSSSYSFPPLLFHGSLPSPPTNQPSHIPSSSVSSSSFLRPPSHEMCMPGKV